MCLCTVKHENLVCILISQGEPIDGNFHAPKNFSFNLRNFETDKCKNTIAALGFGST